MVCKASARLTGEDLYILWCSGIEGLYACLTGEDLYIYEV